tara:strand:- start:8 stop:232 length:225 start_codon:yes stop_codon:yes gene_type:complete
MTNSTIYTADIISSKQFKALIALLILIIILAIMSGVLEGIVAVIFLGNAVRRMMNRTRHLKIRANYGLTIKGRR